MYCPNCGDQILKSDQKYCHNCGFDLSVVHGDSKPKQVKMHDRKRFQEIAREDHTPHEQEGVTEKTKHEIARELLAVPTDEKEEKRSAPVKLENDFSTNQDFSHHGMPSDRSSEVGTELNTLRREMPLNLQEMPLDASKKSPRDEHEFLRKVGKAILWGTLIIFATFSGEIILWVGMLFS
jgi:ribosomal protein L37E